MEFSKSRNHSNITNNFIIKLKYYQKQENRSFTKS